MKRFLSVDVLRGFAVLLMILVNSIDGKVAYPILVHASWHGCTLADVVFPLFIFTVGASVVFAMTACRAKGLTNTEIISKVIKRALFLFAVGGLVNAFPNHLDGSPIRILGILQRIAICYFVAAILFLTTRPKTQFVIIVSLLVVYWLLMTQVPVPGYGVSQLTKEGNFASYIDRLLIPTRYLYHKLYDPEGLLSTLPAIATTLFGNLLGIWLMSARTQEEQFKGMVATGLVVLIMGWFWGLSFPINKALWSSSYVLWTGGIALLIFAFFYLLIEMQNLRKWCSPLALFGRHAMLVFVLHVLFLKLQVQLFVTNALNERVNLRSYFTTYLFPDAAPQHAALFYALTSVGFWFLVVFLVDKLIACQRSKEH